MAEVLDIVYYPDSRLRKRSIEVTKKELASPEFAQLLADMAKTMAKNKGIGLAAVQIGKLIRLTVIETKDGVLPLINPVITKRSWAKETDEEGCLSIPGVFGPVKRHASVTVQAVDINGESYTLTAKGLFARVIQHEIDHMDGVLFIDKSKVLSTKRGKIKVNEIEEFLKA